MNRPPKHLLSSAGKRMHLERAANGFRQRQARQRQIAGMRIAEVAALQAAHMEALWQQTVSSIPFYRRCWLALLILFGKWGTWPGSGHAQAPAEPSAETSMEALPNAG